MLTNEQIADKLFSDLYSYEESIKHMIITRLMDSTEEKAYWDAWFRGAKGEDLESAERGVIYKEI